MNTLGALGFAVTKSVSTSGAYLKEVSEAYAFLNSRHMLELWVMCFFCVCVCIHNIAECTAYQGPVSSSLVAEL